MGEQFGRYELLRRIGVGGMAEVFRAKTFGAEGFVKDVVIKRILPAFNEDPDFVTMFINEARLAARLQHANIVQIFDFNQIGGVYYIAMEWVDGTDLRRVINKARRRAMPIPVRAAVHVGVETLKGLHYASTRAEEGVPLNIVHRDISPHNLLVSLAGEVKIADFGIAKVAALASSTRSGMLKGKLTYMSPEQASGQPLDSRSDLFSVGIVLWEMLTGRRLYQGDSEAELFGQVKRAEARSPRSMRAEVPEELDAVILKMLASDRDVRHESAAAALEELSQFAGGGDPLAMSAFLRDLLPELSQENRGETEAQAIKPRHPETVVPVAPPDAPTHTRSPDEPEQAEQAREAVVEEQGPPAPEEPVERAERTEPPVVRPSATSVASASVGSVSSGSVRSDVQTTPQEVGGPRRRLVLLAALVGWIAVCGLLGWWGAGGLISRVRTPEGALRVETSPPGASIVVDGVALGRAPRTVQGPVGYTVHVEAQKGDRRASERRVLTDRDTLKLALKSEARPPDAGSVEAAPPAKPDAARPDAVRPDKRIKRKRDLRRPPPKPDAAHPKPRGMGLVQIRVYPWAQVKIGGRDVGTTPVTRKLRAGAYRIELFNPELEKRVTLRIEVKAGKKTQVSRRWD
jgi:serine/threonine protein kinase